MARKHQTNNKPNSSGGTHSTKHSYEKVDSPCYRRSHDRDKSGRKTNDHQVDQQTGRKLDIDTGRVHGGNKKKEKKTGWFGW